MPIFSVIDTGASGDTFYEGMVKDAANWALAETQITNLKAGLTTQILVGGGSGVTPVWTTASGTGAPARVGSPTFTGTVTAAAVKITTGAGAGKVAVSDADGDLTWVTRGINVQTVNTQTGAVATGTTALPVDDTIPQITEGDEYMTLAITPTSATNKLLIEVAAYLSNSNALTAVCAALFQDATANALAAGLSVNTTANYGNVISFSHYMTAGTTSATTFRVRGGGATGATTTFNGSAGSRYYGGVMASSITITEIQV